MTSYDLQYNRFGMSSLKNTVVAPISIPHTHFIGGSVGAGLFEYQSS